MELSFQTMLEVLNHSDLMGERKKERNRADTIVDGKGLQDSKLYLNK